MDDFRIYESELSALDIATLYSTYAPMPPTPPPAPSAPPLVGQLLPSEFLASMVFFQPQTGAGLCLESPPQSGVYQEACSGSLYQAFQITPVTGVWYQIIDSFGDCLSLTTSPGEMGTWIDFVACNNALTTQLFRMRQSLTSRPRLTKSPHRAG